MVTLVIVLTVLKLFRGGKNVVRKGSWGELPSSSVTTKPSSYTDLRDACLFAEFSHNCARIPNIFAQNVYKL